MSRKMVIEVTLLSFGELPPDIKEILIDKETGSMTREEAVDNLHCNNLFILGSALENDRVFRMTLHEKIRII